MRPSSGATLVPSLMVRLGKMNLGTSPPTTPLHADRDSPKRKFKANPWPAPPSEPTGTPSATSEDRGCARRRREWPDALAHRRVSRLRLLHPTRRPEPLGGRAHAEAEIRFGLTSSTTGSAGAAPDSNRSTAQPATPPDGKERVDGSSHRSKSPRDYPSPESIRSLADDRERDDRDYKQDWNDDVDDGPPQGRCAVLLTSHGPFSLRTFRTVRRSATTSATRDADRGRASIVGFLVMLPFARGTA